VSSHLTPARVLALLLVALCASACFLASDSRHRELWRIPEGYEGWIYTRWNSPSCPALAIRDSYLVIEVPADGLVCTSTALQEGVASDRFVYVGPDGKETEMPPTRAHTRVFEKGNHDLYVFIGSREDFGRIRPSPPARYGP
jgi:hypothetical protein